MGGVRDYQYVPTLTLDTLLESLPQPHFVKIDVEGAEHLVINGASRLIDEVRPRPKFFIEIGRNYMDAILTRLTSSGYLALQADGQALDLDSPPSDILFVHRDFI